MVKKLLKHEFTYYLRTLGLFLPIVLVIGVMARVFRLFDSSDTAIKIAILSSTAMLFVACAALLVLATVVSIVRFYKNLYSAEGYLTLTLPVTNAQHIFVKLLVALVCQGVCLLVVGGASAIALAGKDLDAIVKEFTQSADMIILLCGTANFVWYVIEATVMLLLSAAANMLLYYACITIGQTAKKNRILKAIGAYFVYYMATQVLATLAVIALTLVEMTDLLSDIIWWIDSHVNATIHIYQCAGIGLYAILGTVFWLVTQYIMKEKLNLE